MFGFNLLAFDLIAHRYQRGGPLVLSDFSWEMPPGRSVLLGPNGAGKTTLLAIGADALAPNRGRVRLGELDPARGGQKIAYRRAVAWMPQRVRAIPGMTCREQVAYVGWLKGLSRSDAWTRAQRALEIVDLTERADATAAHLSGGQLRRLGLAQCLTHDSKVLLLDEPTAGLDPEQRARFRDVLLGLPDVPVMVATHQVDDLADLFDAVAVMNHGKIVWQGSPAAFLALAPQASKHPGEDAFRLVLAPTSSPSSSEGVAER
ncbi:MAG: ATP-binding cassette domain-containing protein [Chloroflexota bacterium]